MIIRSTFPRNENEYQTGIMNMSAVALIQTEELTGCFSLLHTR